jgi:hypothetical protein
MSNISKVSRRLSLWALVGTLAVSGLALSGAMGFINQDGTTGRTPVTTCALAQKEHSLSLQGFQDQQIQSVDFSLRTGSALIPTARNQERPIRKQDGRYSLFFSAPPRGESISIKTCSPNFDVNPEVMGVVIYALSKGQVMSEPIVMEDFEVKLLNGPVVPVPPAPALIAPASKLIILHMIDESGSALYSVGQVIKEGRPLYIKSQIRFDQLSKEKQTIDYTLNSVRLLKEIGSDRSLKEALERLIKMHPALKALVDPRTGDTLLLEQKQMALQEALASLYGYPSRQAIGGQVLKIENDSQEGTVTIEIQPTQP